MPGALYRQLSWIQICRVGDKAGISDLFCTQLCVCVCVGGGGGASLTEPCVSRGWAMLGVVLWLTVHYLEGQRYTVLPCMQLSHEAVNTLAKHWSVFQHKWAKRALAVVPLRIFTIQQHAKAITNPQWCVHVNECVHVCVCVCKEGGSFQYANGVTDLVNS